MGSRPCSGCGTTNPRYASVCVSCGYIMDGDRFERRLLISILNELRELNDKRRASHDVLRTDDPIEALKRSYKAGEIGLEELETALDAEIIPGRD